MTPPDPLHGTWPREIPPEVRERILVLAPTANDSRLTRTFLTDAGFKSIVVSSIAELCAKTLEGCGAILVAEEALTSASAERLFGLLKTQPPWSDLPVTVVSSRTSQGQRQAERLSTATNVNISLLERPFRPDTLVRMIEVALRSRRRQYEVQRLLKDVVEARDTAQRASQAKDEFLAALSHELRTPLNPALLLATDAASDASLPERVRSDFEQIARNVALEAQLIDDLLDLTRITHDKLKLDLHRLDAHDAIRAAFATTEAEMIQKKLNVKSTLAAYRSMILGDLTRLQQVFWNVIKNATKFTAPAGHIWIETFNRDSALVVRIADDGAGMESADLTRIFDAFAQGRNVAAGGHRFGGLGLGLAISRKLVELHHGTITAHSDGPGTGASFVLTFPLAAAEPIEPEPNTPAVVHAPCGGNKKLLVVEDHGPTRTSLAQLLRRRGYEVSFASTLAEARTQLETQTFDIVLSDLGLPDGHGYDLMDLLRSHPALHAIALSGYGTEGDIARSYAAGFKAHLTKPIGVQALEAALGAISTEQAGSESAHPVEAVTLSR
ncbi:MAG: ATP-binding protein [Nibricoccus sp.]